MKIINFSRLFKIAVFLNIPFLFYSCMSMMALPNHSSSMHQTKLQAANSNTNIDVVCGKTLDMEQDKFKMEYHDKTYYFDTKDCLNKFQQSPNTYTNEITDNDKNNSMLYWSLGAVSMGVLMFFMIH